MAWRFLEHHGRDKAETALAEFGSAVQVFDTATASRGQAMMMKAELRTLALRLNEIDAQARREHDQTEMIEETRERYLEAAQIIERDLQGIIDPGRAMDMVASLARLLDELEQLKSDFEQEQRKDQHTMAWVERLRHEVEHLTVKLEVADENFRDAKRSRQFADIKKQSSRDRDQRSTAALNLTTTLSMVSVMLDMMIEEASKIRAENDALAWKAKLLQSNRLLDDPNIAVAFVAARPVEQLGHGVLSERLAQLDAHHGHEQIIAA